MRLSYDSFKGIKMPILLEINWQPNFEICYRVHDIIQLQMLYMNAISIQIEFIAVELNGFVS